MKSGKRLGGSQRRIEGNPLNTYRKNMHHIHQKISKENWRCSWMTFYVSSGTCSREDLKRELKVPWIYYRLSLRHSCVRGSQKRIEGCIIETFLRSMNILRISKENWSKPRSLSSLAVGTCPIEDLKGELKVGLGWVVPVSSPICQKISKENWRTYALNSLALNSACFEDLKGELKGNRGRIIYYL